MEDISDATQLDGRPPSDMYSKTSKALVPLKLDSGITVQPPSRASSVPLPTTEISTREESDTPAPTKRRVPPMKTKKGTASALKKDKPPPAKKRKIDSKRADTPSSRASKVTAGKMSSAKGTPMNSSPVPSTRSQSGEPQEEGGAYDVEDGDNEDGRSQDGDLYCICRKPDNGQFMIGCDGKCDDWFHGKCVGISEKNKNLIEKYICPNCAKASVGQTAWKRMCRREGCTNPVMAKSKSGLRSKYCSDECGVYFWREMGLRTRGADVNADHRTRKRVGLDGFDEQGDDFGARGGALSIGEVKALLDASKTAEAFRKLGDGVLSPPATPNSDEARSVPQYTEQEAQELHRIETEKEHARERHAMLKERMKFVLMTKKATSRVATEKELKPKDYCGYDPRVEWDEDQFKAWRKSESGQHAYELDYLAPPESRGNSTEHDEPQINICDRKKCARHFEWNKLAVDDLRLEMSDNGDKMRALDREENEIKERAALSNRTGRLSEDGSVEIHGLFSRLADTIDHGHTIKVAAATQMVGNG